MLNSEYYEEPIKLIANLLESNPCKNPREILQTINLKSFSNNGGR
jgi:hypothetical protein